jgi:hypothetical protein
MLGQPTTDCAYDSMDPKGKNWIMVDLDMDGNADMAVAKEEVTEMNKYGISAVHKGGKFYAFRHGKMVGGPFDTMQELQDFQLKSIENESYDMNFGESIEEQPVGREKRSKKMSYTKLNIKELQNRLDTISEHSITTRDGVGFDQEDFNLAHAVTVLANKLIADAGDAYDGKFLTQQEYFNDATEKYGYPDMEEVNLPAYGDLDDDDMEKFMANYKEPDPIGESVQEGEAELAELKSALGRTGGVMGLEN